MPLDIEWSVSIGDFSAGFTDFTSRLAGFDLDEQLTLNAIATFTATVTLNNFDGALTPGGGGTYGSVDWFSQLITIDWDITGGALPLTDVGFQGMIQGFTLFDDGETSTVTLRCIDTWSVAGRTKQGSITAIAEQDPQTYITNAATLGQFSAAFPLFGLAPPWGGFIADEGTAVYRAIKTTVAVDNVSFADLINQLVMPSVTGYMWPKSYDSAGWIGGGFHVNSLLGEQVFDTAPNVTGTELPFTRLEQGWNIDETINTATVTSMDQPFGPLPSTSTDTTAANKYGSRAVQFNQAANVNYDPSVELVNRFATPTFGPVTLTVTASAIRSYCNVAAYSKVGYLLSMSRFFKNKATIIWKGAGLGSTQTATCAMLGRRIRATPNDTEIILSLGKWADYHSFILDTDKLDVDRIA
jgi:hypothetical protein